MKKRFLIATLVAIFSFSCGNKNEETQQQDAMQEVAPTTSTEVKVEVTDFDRYEGKIVLGTNGQWYLIKEGVRWRTNSIAATVDIPTKVPHHSALKVAIYSGAKYASQTVLYHH